MWRVAAIAALLAPSRLSGVLDGAPVDLLPEAIVLGLLVPALAWLHPQFVQSITARALIVFVLLLKLGAPLVLEQDGWCLAFDPPRPMMRDSTGKPHAWDPRADWLAPDPRCSAVMTRAYLDTLQVPAWFFNLPPPDDAPHRGGYGPGEFPVRLTLSGYLTVPDQGTLRIDTTAPMLASVTVDGRPLDAAAPGRHEIGLSAGTHLIHLDATLLGRDWRVVPQWNGSAMGSMWFPSTTINPPSRRDRVLRPYANWIASAVVVSLIMSWFVSFLRDAGAASMLVWSGAATASVAVMTNMIAAEAAWYTAVVTLVPLLLAVHPRWKNARGAFLLIGVPWLAYIAALTAGQVGRWTLYGVGNDNFQFQRFAYRIFLQQYWLEGGQPTFWNQPFFRWIAGALHMVFGDSSVGQAYWDAAAVLMIALFAYRVVHSLAGFWWGVAAAIVPLWLFLLGPNAEFVGFGLSEISSAGLIYLAATFAMRGRAGDAWIAGLLAVLGVYTRLNNFPMAAAVMLFALPIATPTHAAWRVATWRMTQWRVVTIVGGMLCAGLLLFAARTWYYTGVFSVFHGTQRDHLAVWRPGMSVPAALESMFGSVMMVLTASDPPQFAWHALPLLVAAGIVLAAVANLPIFRDAPLVLVGLFVAGCSSALVTRGWAYEGRFSVHLFGSAAALCAWSVASAVRRARGRFWYSPVSSLPTVKP